MFPIILVLNKQQRRMKIVHKDDYNKNRWMNKDLTRLQQHPNKSINQILNFGLHT